MPKSAAAFKRSVSLTLPSGLEVEVRKPNVKKLVLHSKKGEVPEFLTNLVLGGMNGTITNPQQLMEGLSDEKKLEAVDAVTQFGVILLKSMLVWPVISDNPDYENGEIALEDLDEADQDFLTAWGMPKDAQAAEDFHKEQASGVALTSDVPTVQPATE